MVDKKITHIGSSWNEDSLAKEKLLYQEASSLSDAELMGVIIGSGNAKISAVQIAKGLLAKHKNNLHDIAQSGFSALRSIDGINDKTAVVLCGVFELAKRIKLSQPNTVEVIKSNADVFALMNPIIGELRHEEFWAIYLTGTNRVIERRRISSGGVDRSVVDVKMVMKKAVELLSASIIVVHNHPSANISPSGDDIEITNRIKSCCDLMDVRFLDHIIISGGESLSFREKKLI